MNRNQQLLESMTHFYLQVDEIGESLRKAVGKRLKVIHTDLISAVYSSRGQLNNRNIPNLISGSLVSLLQQLVSDVNESLYEILQRSRVAFPKFVNQPVKSEALDLSLIDPFGLTDLGENNNAFTLFAEILGISEDDTRILFSEMLLFGLLLGDMWQIWLIRQRDQIRQRLAQALSQFNDDEDTGVSDRVLRDVQRILGETILGDGINSIKFTLQGIVTSVLFSQTQQMVNKTVQNNPVVFTGKYLWVGVLDSSICKRCGALHNRVFDFGSGPISPLHPFCRCFPVPLINNGGSVSSSDFNQWLKGQSVGTQDEILGKRGGDLFRQGRVRFKDFISFRNSVVPRERTIDEIERIGR